jgi:predicted PurR-regulated permease PerM
MSPRRFLPFVLVALTSGAIYLTLRLALPFLPAIAWALALAIIGNPLFSRLSRRFPNRPATAALLSVVIIVLVVLTPLAILTNSVVRETARASDYFETLDWRALPFVDWLDDRINLRSELERLFTTVRDRIGPLLRGTADVLLQTGMTLFFLFFFFRDQQLILDTLRSYLPLSNEETSTFFERAWEMIYATINGILIVAAVQGFLGGLMFWILGLPGPILWGFVMIILSTIPMLGAFVIWIPAAIYLLILSQWWKAIILLVWGSFVVGLIDNLLYPMLVGRDTRTHTLPVFIAIIGGIVVFGASGLILGPLVLAVTSAFLDIWRARLDAHSKPHLVTPPHP